MIQRYEFEVCNEYASSCDAMQKDPDGDYVLYSDHLESIAFRDMTIQTNLMEYRAEVERLREALERIVKACDAVDHAHGIKGIAKEALLDK